MQKQTKAFNEVVKKIIWRHFKQVPLMINHISIGICNEVYCVQLVDKEIIVRLSTYKKFLMGSHDHIPQFKALGITVPTILAEDYGKTLVPFCYQIQNKIEGQDLGQVIQDLTPDQLRSLSKEVAKIFHLVKAMPTTGQFGVIWGGGENDLSDTWTDRMRIWLDESIARGIRTGVIDDMLLTLAENLFHEYKPYFNSVQPTMYYGDISSKNVMIYNGKFSGLVDLDGLTQGDPLEALGRIKLSWYGTAYGEFYNNELMRELKITPAERKLVTMYALLNQISLTCENGIEFNQNTKAIVNKQQEKNDKKIIRALIAELGLE